MKKIIVFVLISFTTLSAQNAGSAGLSFLKLGFGARNIAMGDAGNALSEDVTALFYNPAKLAIDPKSEIIFMHNQWVQDLSSEVFGARTVIWGIPIALGANITSIDEIEVRTKPGEPEAKFNANYFFGSLSTGFKIVDEIYFGVTAKYLYEGLYQDDATGLGFDFGLSYITPIENLTASVVLKNLGSMNQLRYQKTVLPTEFRVGAMYFYEVSSSIDVYTAAELQKYKSEDNAHFNLGLEGVYDKTIAVRAGYQTGYETRGLTYGFGLAWGSFKFDYAYTPFSLGIGNANIFSIQLSL